VLKAIIAGGIAVASIIPFLVFVGVPQITYEKQNPALSQEQVCDDQGNCSVLHTEEIEEKPKLVFKPIYEISEQNQAVVEDPSAKYYAEQPASYACELRNAPNTTPSIGCTFEDGSSFVQQIRTTDVALVESRLSYCNEIIQHRSASLDKEPMLRCLFDAQE